MFINSTNYIDSPFHQKRRRTFNMSKRAKAKGNEKKKLMLFTTVWPILRSETAFNQLNKQKSLLWLLLFSIPFRRNNGMHFEFLIKSSITACLKMPTLWCGHSSDKLLIFGIFFSFMSRWYYFHLSFWRWRMRTQTHFWKHTANEQNVGRESVRERTQKRVCFSFCYFTEQRTYDKMTVRTPILNGKGK